MVKTKKGVSASSLYHPNSRKVHQLTKQVKKEAARNKSKVLYQMRQNLIGEKFLWFRDNLPKDAELHHDIIACTIKKYLGRFDEELDQIQLKHSMGQRKNRQHASREDIIKLTKLQEEEEYKTSGIELPNLLLPKQVEMLHQWNGELRFIQNFKLRRFSENFLRESERKSRPSSPFKTDTSVDGLFVTHPVQSNEESSDISIEKGDQSVNVDMDVDVNKD